MTLPIQMSALTRTLWTWTVRTFPTRISECYHLTLTTSEEKAKG